MELNERRKNAQKLDSLKFIKEGHMLYEAFPLFLEATQNDNKDYYIEYNGVRYYSFETEDEMYVKMSGLKKQQYFEYEAAFNDIAAKDKKLEKQYDPRKKDPSISLIGKEDRIAKAHEISVFKFAGAGDRIEKAFKPFLNATKNDLEKDYYIEWNGVKYYSFQTEDEMYIALSGLNKEDYLEYRQKTTQLSDEKYNLNKEKRHDITNNLLYEGRNSVFENAKYVFGPANFYDFLGNIDYLEYGEQKALSNIIEAASDSDFKRVQNIFNNSFPYDYKSFIGMKLKNSTFFDKIYDSVNEDMLRYYRNDQASYLKNIKKLNNDIAVHKSDNIVTMAELEKQKGKKFTIDNYKQLHDSKKKFARNLVEEF